MWVLLDCKEPQDVCGKGTKKGKPMEGWDENGARDLVKGFV